MASNSSAAVFASRASAFFVAVEGAFVTLDCGRNFACEDSLFAVLLSSPAVMELDRGLGFFGLVSVENDDRFTPVPEFDGALNWLFVVVVGEVT